MLDVIGADLSNYVMLAVFFTLGLVGSYGHYAKDKYLERTIDCTLWYYITNDKKSTYNTLKAIAAASVPLAIAHSGGYLPALSEVYAAVLAGYGSDSLLNSAEPK